MFATNIKYEQMKVNGGVLFHKKKKLVLCCITFPKQVTADATRLYMIEFVYGW